MTALDLLVMISIAATVSCFAVQSAAPLPARVRRRTAPAAVVVRKRGSLR
jgi:hypothetical protein